MHIVFFSTSNVFRAEEILIDAKIECKVVPTPVTDKIDAKINRLVDLRAAINAAIESMENPEERLLLKYRYLKNESWEDISYDLNVSYRTVHRIHASALNNFVVPE